MDRPTLLLLVALPAGSAASAVGAQSVEPTAVPVAGRVVRLDDGSPLPNVRVAGTTHSGLGDPLTLTDADGRFTVTVTSDQMRVGARKAGFAPQTVPVTGPGTLVIRLAPGAAISGRIVDDAGQPVIGARVTAESPRPGQGRANALAQADTDDRGEFRLGSLPAAPLVVGVSTRGGADVRVVGGRTTSAGPAQYRRYYPGASERDQAEVFTLEPGEEVERVDIVVPRAESTSQPLSVLESVTPLGPVVASVAPTGPSTGRIAGRVASADGTPVATATVTLTPRDTAGPPRVAQSGADGRFAFTDLPAGRYRVRASKPGYLQERPDARRGGPNDGPGVAVVVAADERLADVGVSLTPWGTVSGQVLDEHGEPVQGAVVRALQVRYRMGRRQLVAVGPVERRTDDLGRYRLFGLAAGAYVVSASVSELDAGDVPGFIRTFYPGTARAGDARFVQLGAGTHLTNVDVDLVRSPTFRVSGNLYDASGRATMGGRVQLVTSQQAGAAVTEALNARITRDGRFEFPHVPPGAYVVQVQASNRNGYTEGEFAAFPVVVSDGDLTNLQVQASAGSILAGRVVFARTGSTTLPASTRVSIQALPVEFDAAPAGGRASAEIVADGRFLLAGLNGPRRIAVSRVPPGWMVEAVRVNGVDVTNRALPFGRAEQSLTDVEIVLTDRVTSIRGSVVDRNRAPGSARVLVFPTDRSRWFWQSPYLRQTATGADGAFSIDGIPPGTYWVATARELPPDGDGAWQDPQFLEGLVRNAQSLPLSIGEQRTIGPLALSDR